MNYIQKKIDLKITISGSKNTSDLSVIYQALLEFNMLFIMAYLWDKNIDKLDPDVREWIYEKIRRPSIGEVLDICRKMDLNKEIFGRKELAKKIAQYPNIRNTKIGHGYTFVDGSNDLIHDLRGICESVIGQIRVVLGDNVDIIHVSSKKGHMYEGINFKSDLTYYPWQCPEEVSDFILGDTYAYFGASYFRLSPFVEFVTEDEYYIYASLHEPLTGKCRYNRLLVTGQKYFEKSEFINADIEGDGIKRRTVNGTIISEYQNNYKNFIQNAIVDKIEKFLLKSKHAVTATVWGHGGVGKTASVQRICEDLTIRQGRTFDYIVFTTAKDRYYNYMTGVIEDVHERISSCEELVKQINNILIGKPIYDTDILLNLNQKVLLVIDDYETFEDVEKEKIVSFLKRLDVNRHKVIITTRSNIIIGEEIKSDELTLEESLNFLEEVIKNEFGVEDNRIIQKIRDDRKIQDELLLVTSGRPLFIYQLAYLIQQKGDIEEAFDFKITKTKNAIDFLYGRIYNYLSSTAKDIFVVMSLLVSDVDLNNLLEKVIYILGYDSNRDGFNAAINELEKLKIIQIKEQKFFQIYSQEILTKMVELYNERDQPFKMRCNKRLEGISRDKSMNNDQALLQSADNGRYSKNEEEVRSTYRQILNRIQAPKDIKQKAVINLASYLNIQRGKRDEAIEELESRFHEFKNDGPYIKLYATYLWSVASKSSKEKAIEILSGYISVIADPRKDIEVELAGLHMTYKGLYLVQRKEDLKGEKEIENIDDSVFRRENADLKRDMKETAGVPAKRLVMIAESESFKNRSAGAIQNVATGMMQLVEINSRLNRYERAIELCDVALKQLPNHHHRIFEKKKNQNIHWSYATKSNMHPKGNTDLGDVLSEAMKKKEGP